MFRPVRGKESHSVQKCRINKKQRKQKKRLEQRVDKRKFENNLCIPSAMSAWAENFTVAATWQLKHQIAYWKAKAISLQYENSMLHEVIQRNHIAVPTSSRRSWINSDSEFGHSAAEHSDIQTEACETQENDTDTDSESENDENQDENEGQDFEVSEEFIQFLTSNAKYREDARRERERLKAKEEEYSLQPEEAQESVEDKIARKKELYGDKYQKMIALEMYQMCNFKNECDKLKPAYWPNIPLNLNSS